MFWFIFDTLFKQLMWYIRAFYSLKGCPLWSQSLNLNFLHSLTVVLKTERYANDKKYTKKLIEDYILMLCLALFEWKTLQHFSIIGHFSLVKYFCFTYQVWEPEILPQSYWSRHKNMTLWRMSHFTECIESMITKREWKNKTWWTLFMFLVNNT
jgi:hypothetical protein